MQEWLEEKLARLVFLLDALFEAVQLLGVITIVLLTRWVVLWLANLAQASEETKAFVGWFVHLAEVVLVVACFGVNLPFVLRDIRETWRRAFHPEPQRLNDNQGEMVLPPAPNQVASTLSGTNLPVIEK